MFCIHCGKELPEGAKFCIFCGKAAVVSESPVPSQAPEQKVSAPTSPVEDPVTVPPSTEDTTKVSLTENSPESSVALESKLQPEEEASAVASRKTADCQVTFMRWDTSGPELTITFSQGEPLVLTSYESRTVTLPSGTQHITMDTASWHTECDLPLNGDSKINLRWDEENRLFYAEYNARKNFEVPTRSEATPPEPTRPDPAPPTAATVSQTSVSTPKNANNVRVLWVGLCAVLTILLVVAVVVFVIPHPLTEKQVIGLWVNDPLPQDPDSLFPSEPQDKFYLDFQDDNLVDLIILPVYSQNVQMETAIWHIEDGKRIILALSDGTSQYVTMENKKLVLREGNEKATFSRAKTTIDKIPTPKPTAGKNTSTDYDKPSTPSISTPTPATDPNILYITYDGDIDIYDFIGEYGGIDNDPPELDDMEGLSISWEDSDTIYFTSGGYRELHFDFYANCTDLTGNRLDITDENGDCYAFYYLPALSSPYHKDTIYWSLNPESDDYWTDYKAYVRDDDTDNYNTTDFSWLEAEYANEDGDEWLSMTLQSDEFESDALCFCFYRTSWSDGNTEIIADGRVSYVSGEETPRFEGYLFSIMESITIEYTGNDSFTVNCPTLGFSDVSFFYYAEL